MLSIRLFHFTQKWVEFYGNLLGHASRWNDRTTNGLPGDTEKAASHSPLNFPLFHIPPALPPFAKLLRLRGYTWFWALGYERWAEGWLWWQCLEKSVRCFFCLFSYNHVWSLFFWTLERFSVLFFMSFFIHSWLGHVVRYPVFEAEFFPWWWRKNWTDRSTCIAMKLTHQPALGIISFFYCP